MSPISVDLQVERNTGVCLLRAADLLRVQCGEPICAAEEHLARNVLDLPQ